MSAKKFLPPGFKIIAHRGASLAAPENTRAAFDRALQMQVQDIELDVRRSCDGRVVVCHDKTLHRYGHGYKAVEDLNWSALEILDMSSWFSPSFTPVQKMILLDEALNEYLTQVTLHIELRAESIELCESAATLLQNYPHKKYIITSAFLSNLKTINRLLPFVRLSWLIDKIDDDVLLQAKQISLFQLCPKVSHVSAPDVARALKLVPQIRGRGCSGEKPEVFNAIQLLIDCGAHGATVDAPDWFMYET
jgi:glycerophosphoryl diester phosphodiesterase